MEHSSPVLVTGGAGFIGSHLVDALLARGYAVRVLDNLSTGKRANLPLDNPRLELIEGDVADAALVRRAVAGCRAVAHLAAVASVQASVDDPVATHQSNFIGTLNVCEAMREAGVRRVLFASSAAVYGNNGEGQAIDEDTPKAPLTPYAADKLASEHYLDFYRRQHGLEPAVFRFFNIFGPRQSADNAYAAVIAAFAKRILAAEPPIIYGDGRQTRDFTHVSNAVLACLLAAASDKPLRGEVVNVGTGRRIDLLGLLAAMQQAAGILPSAAPPPHFEPQRAGDVRHSLADISRARDLLGYEPVVSLEDGLADTMAWYRTALSEAS